MKKLLFLLLIFVPFWGFSQFGAGDFIDADTTKVKGESLIYPAPTMGEHYYKGARNPSDSLDVVNLRFLFQRLAELDSLGLLVSDMVSGSQIVNTGETQITFPSQFDTGTVVVVPYVRRVSDNAVIDYSINDVDSMGFDIVVWEDNIKVSYMASNRATNNFSMLTAYVNDSSYIKQAIRAYLRDSSILVKSPAPGVDYSIPHYVGANKTDTTDIYWRGGKLGFHTNLPAYTLDIYQDAGVQGNMRIRSYAPTIVLTGYRTTGVAATWNFAALQFKNDVATADLIRLGVLVNQNIGSTPTLNYYFMGNTYNDNCFRIYPDRKTLLYMDYNSTLDSTWSFMPSGRLGGGTSAPDRKLEINSMTGSNLRLTYNDANGSAANYMDLTTESSGNGVINVAAGDTVKLGGATNYTGIEPDGTIVFRGNSTVWDDVNTGVAAAKLPAANFPAWTAFTANTNAYTFALNDYADLSTIEIPHSYKEGSNLEVHCHIATNGTNNATARKVQYLVYYTYCVPDNGSYQFSAEASLKAELTIPANQADKSGYYISLGTITGTNIKIGTQLKLRFKRIASTGTEPINDPFVGMVGVHYEKDTEGSRTISTK